MMTNMQEVFNQLASHAGGRCLSIYMPTHRSGQEVLNQEDRLHLKNLIREIGGDLDERGFDRKNRDEFLAPVEGLLNDQEFWRQQSEGLAIFRSLDHFETLSLPFSLDPVYHLSYEFYLKPLIPLLMGDGRYFLLTLNLEDPHLYEGSRLGLQKAKLPKPLPERMEQVVGWDVEESSSGHHGSRAGGHGQSIHHGQGDGKDDRKPEILEFFREVEHRVTEALGSQRAPLVLAGMDHLVGAYRQVNHYPHLYPEAIDGNPQFEPRPELARKAWDLLAFHFDKGRQVKTDLMNQFHDTDRTSLDIREIVPAAMNGRVDTLFLDPGAMMWGIYDPSGAEVRLQEEQNILNIELGNRVAIEVLLHGGEVYLSDKEALPQPYSPINALYRY